MTKIKQFLIYCFLFAVSCWLLTVFVDARYLRYKQTDPDDIVTRNKIDRDIDGWIERLDRQIQVDTLKTKASSQSDTVYLDRKYKDANYRIFVTVLTSRPTTSIVTPVATPLTDSSFTIKMHCVGNDSSSVQWMTIRK